MKKLIMAAAVLCTLTAAAETYTGLVVDMGGACVITEPDNPKQTLVNLKWNLKPDVEAYVGKIVTIEGILDPTKAFATMETITSISEAK